MHGITETHHRVGRTLKSIEKQNANIKNESRKGNHKHFSFRNTEMSKRNENLHQ